jgi:hypothetical protein
LDLLIASTANKARQAKIAVLPPKLPAEFVGLRIENETHGK